MDGSGISNLALPWDIVSLGGTRLRVWIGAALILQALMLMFGGCFKP